MSNYEGSSNAEVEQARNEVQGMIEAGAKNAEIRRTLCLSEDGLLNVIRKLLEEQSR